MLANVQRIDVIASIRTNDFSETLGSYLAIAKQLERTGLHEYVARANFIREQCNGETGKELFDKYREEWDIPTFEEELINVHDFKRGFLWRFRDHTTSWSDNQKAKSWFLTSPESLFVRRYEFWTWDNKQDECIDIREGGYKEILSSLLSDGDYEVLCSPVFSADDLNVFIKRYTPEEGDYEIEEIIEDYIESNPNYKRSL